jgi:hypothetical protein
MTIEQMLRLIGGAFVAASVLAGMYVHPYFFWFTLFVGLNLVQSAFTGWCPMVSILRRAGVRDSALTRSAGIVLVAALAFGAATTAQAAGQQCPNGGCMMAGRGAGNMADRSMADMPLVHFLLDNGTKVRRTITLRPDGVETITESSDPAIAKAIQDHVAAMYARVTEKRPIHQHDPLFRAIFEHASQISFAHETVVSGVKVIETSTDPYVVKLIQAHAQVLDRFIQNGRSEAMRNHPVPTRE